MKLIVFGATGLLGSRLVTEALRRGHEVTASAREPSAMSDLEGVRAVPADVMLDEAEHPDHSRERFTVAH
jgi:putative NADH-flavin reductase